MSKPREVIVGSWSYFVENQPQKLTALHSMGSTRLQCSSTKVSFFWIISHSVVPHSKIYEKKMLSENLQNFLKWLLIQVDHTWLNSYPYIQRMGGLKLF